MEKLKGTNRELEAANERADTMESALLDAQQEVAAKEKEIASIRRDLVDARNQWEDSKAEVMRLHWKAHLLKTRFRRSKASLMQSGQQSRHYGSEMQRAPKKWERCRGGMQKLRGTQSRGRLKPNRELRLQKSARARRRSGR